MPFSGSIGEPANPKQESLRWQALAREITSSTEFAPPVSSAVPAAPAGAPVATTSPSSRKSKTRCRPAFAPADAVTR